MIVTHGRLFASRTNLTKTVHPSIRIGLNWSGPWPNLCVIRIFCAQCAQRAHHAGQGTERLSHPNRPSNADGPVFPQLLDTGVARLGAGRARLSAGANPTLVGEAGRIPRHRRPAWSDRGVLRPSPRLAVVRA